MSSDLEKPKSTPKQANMLDDLQKSLTEGIEQGLQDLVDTVSNIPDTIMAFLKEIPILGPILVKELATGDKTKSPDKSHNDNSPSKTAGLNQTMQDLVAILKITKDKINQDPPKNLTAALPVPSRVVASMMGLFEKESQFNATAQNPRSSARGLGQFLTSTWNNMVSKYGSWLEANGFSRTEIHASNARDNPRLNATMTMLLACDNFVVLKKNGMITGWDDPSLHYKLYSAHHHGAQGAITYLQNNNKSSEYQSFDEKTAQTMRSWESKVS